MDEFQSLLGKLALNHKPRIYVETGFMTGESAKAVCNSMDKNKAGKVYSIEPFVDPNYKHPRLTVAHGYSYDQMQKIFIETGPWDMFLHDSNHDVGCMSFELELAWAYTAVGGIIACDDYTWGTPPHNAWQSFLARHGVNPVQLGSAQYCIRIADGVTPVKTSIYADTSARMANLVSNDASKRYGDKPLFGPINAAMKTYCLTLHETPDREAACRKHFAERGVNAEFIYGLHAGTCGLRTINNYEVDNPGGGHNIGAHGAGIWTSFLMIYQIALQQPDEHFFMLEHDAEFEPDWKEKFDQAMKDVPKDFDFLFVGHCCLGSDHTKKRVKGNVWEVKRPFCNHASVIAKKCLPFVIKTLKSKCWAPIDIQLVSEVFPKLKVYAVIPTLAGQFDTVLQA